MVRPGEHLELAAGCCVSSKASASWFFSCSQILRNQVALLILPVDNGLDYEKESKIISKLHLSGLPKVLLRILFLLSEMVICFIAGLWFSRFMWRNDLFKGMEDDLSLIFASGFIAYCLALSINTKPFERRLAAVAAMDLYFYIMADSVEPVTVFVTGFASATIVMLPYWFAKHKREQERLASVTSEDEDKNKAP
jgi:hypothetical protein